MVETVVLSAFAGTLYYRVRRAPLIDAAHPDALARELAGLGRHQDNPAQLLHSTSWRLEAGTVVLTYAALPDPEPFGATPLYSGGDVPFAADPLAPTEVALTARDVAIHACRHLAYLRGSDPVVAATADYAPALWELIDEFSPALAGVLYAA